MRFKIYAKHVKQIDKIPRAEFLSNAAIVTFTNVDTSNDEHYADGIFRVDGKPFSYEELHGRFEYLVFIPEKDSEQ